MDNGSSSKHQNHNVPKIRFPGFEGEWERVKLSDYCDFLQGLTYKPEDVKKDGTLVLRSSNIQNSVLCFNDNVYVSSDMIPSKISTKSNDVLMCVRNGSRNLVGKTALISQRYAGLAWGAFMNILRPHKNNTFLYFFLNSRFFRNQIDADLDTATVKQITIGTLNGVEISIPHELEQEKIATFLLLLDERITKQRELIEKLKTYKRGALSVMFPQKGETVPRCRFASFSGEWEKRKLGEIVQFSKGSGYSKSDLKESGTPIILYGRLYTKYETVISNVDTYAEPKEGSVFSHGGEVIVPASGETAEDISIASVVEKSGFLLGGDLNIITPPRSLNSAFLALSISYGNPHNEMAKMAQGKSVVHLHNSDLEKIVLLHPSIEEQTHICEYFQSLDNLISLHQRKLDLLIKTKQSLLQQLFI